MANTVKIPADVWLNAAKDALIEGGVAGVKIDRLAKGLGVTRGGFYHHFSSRQDLLTRLLNLWFTSNCFLPEAGDVTTPAEAADAFDLLVRNLLSENSFSPEFDLAIREWGRVDAAVQTRVDEMDRGRLSILEQWFTALGCDSEEALVRARVLYFHQIGFYSLGYHSRQDQAQRGRRAPVYMNILCGSKYLAAPRSPDKKVG